jgi:hypothetical protein
MEEPMSDKRDLVRDTEAAFAELRQAFDGLAEDRMRERWLGAWGVREILVHISGWHREMGAALDRVARGEEPYPAGAYDDFDAWNARFVEERAGVKVADVVAELESSHRSFVNAATAVPDSHYGEGGQARGLLDGAGAAHYREHAEQIRAWRARQ